MEHIKVIQGVEINRLKAGENGATSKSYQIYDADAPYDADCVLPVYVACQVAIEILKDVFLGTGKPYPVAEALQCLEAMLPRSRRIQTIGGISLVLKTHLQGDA